jgi:hypothetical protein
MMNRTILLPENDKQRALLYTMGICTLLLLLLFLVRWTKIIPPEPLVSDIIEVENLGNDLEGFGEQQPLKKGNPSPEPPNTAQQTGGAPIPTNNQPLTSPTNTPDAASLPARNPVNQPKTTPNTNPGTGSNPSPKLTFPGKQPGPNGNNATEDNGFTSQGNNPNSGGDVGNQQGKPMEVITKSITQAMLQNYVDKDILKEAKIRAVIDVNADGSARINKYVNIVVAQDEKIDTYKKAVNEFLKKMDFTKTGNPYQVTVIFNFKVN